MRGIELVGAVEPGRDDDLVECVHRRPMIARDAFRLVGDHQPALARRRLRGDPGGAGVGMRSEEHTSELQSLMRISYAVFCLKKKTKKQLENKRAHRHK